MVIDLRSDTVTKPTPGMRKAMAEAEVGDDMLGEDPTVNALEARVAAMLGKEAAVYACSGTQGNQLAIWAHCRAGDELLIHHDGHITWYEGGAAAVVHGVTCRHLSGPGGMFDVADLDAAILPVDQHYCRTRLVCLENTTNRGGGRVWSVEQAMRVADRAHALGLRTHMDGARLMNACVAGGYSPAEVTAGMDTVSICFSKGLGCPMGSMLVGTRADIAQARRGRKVMGGALRQAGIVAASALYALDHHVERLAEDHANAKRLAECLTGVDGVTVDAGGVQTNIVHFDVDPARGTGAQLAAALARRGVKMYSTGPQRLRAVTHLDVGRADVERAAEIVGEVVGEGFADTAAGGSANPYSSR
ncbi:MAG: low specificity L-threonine aldolase [Phycisphaera sp.]|nr:low specificity L-threonine aldolase [Phycisphaera sp.]